MEETLEYWVEPDAYNDVEEVSSELREGVAGMEYSLFVGDIGNMYMSYCEAQGWRVSILLHQGNVILQRL